MGERRHRRGHSTAQGPEPGRRVRRGELHRVRRPRLFHRDTRRHGHRTVGHGRHAGGDDAVRGPVGGQRKFLARFAHGQRRPALLHRGGAPSFGRRAACAVAHRRHTRRDADAAFLCRPRGGVCRTAHRAPHGPQRHPDFRGVGVGGCRQGVVEERRDAGGDRPRPGSGLGPGRRPSLRARRRRRQAVLQCRQWLLEERRHRDGN